MRTPYSATCLARRISQLSDAYRFNLAKRVLANLTDQRDQNLGIGRWKHIGKRKKKDKLNRKLYAPAVEGSPR